jgi:16S rRNA G966 N2-methylase RsmD
MRGINETLKRLGYMHKGLFLKKDVFGVLGNLKTLGHRYDLIFISPPYDLFRSKQKNVKLSRFIQKMVENHLTSSDPLFIIEHRMNEGFLEIPQIVTIKDKRRYGQTEISFYGIKISKDG